MVAQELAMCVAQRRRNNSRRAHDASDRLGLVRTASVFVGAGRLDIVAPLSNAEAVIQLTGAEKFELYEGGHVLFLQDPRAFADPKDFLA
jgi:pimeloyl-ACP methyl ester carboxylesterase